MYKHSRYSQLKDVMATHPYDLVMKMNAFLRMSDSEYEKLWKEKIKPYIDCRTNGLTDFRKIISRGPIWI